MVVTVTTETPSMAYFEPPTLVSKILCALRMPYKALIRWGELGIGAVTSNLFFFFLIFIVQEKFDC